MNSTISITSRARGCLLGLACGDALGGPLEFMGRTEIAHEYGTVADFVGGGWLSLRPGETTDDTQMMVALAQSIIEQHGVDENDIAARWVEWLRSEPKDVGNATADALRLIGEGATWRDAGRLVDQKAIGGALGNGSIMRCAPIAIYLYHDLKELARRSITTSAITHANPICTWSAAALNLILSQLLQGQYVGVIDRVARSVANDAVREALEGLSGMTEADLVTTGEVRATLLSALWCLGNTSSFEEAVIAAVNLGGDADTRGAVTGCLAGAHYGEDTIPSRWLTQLEGRELISDLAERLLEV